MGVMHLPVGCCEGETWSWVPGPMSHGSASPKHGSAPGLEQDSACCVRGLLRRESLQNVWWLPKRHSVTLGPCHQPQCDPAKLVCPVLSWPLNLQAGQELRPVTTPGDVFILTMLGFHLNAQFTGKAGTSGCCVERHLDQFTLKTKMFLLAIMNNFSRLISGIKPLLPLILKPPSSWKTCRSLDCMTRSRCCWGGDVGLSHGDGSPVQCRPAADRNLSRGLGMGVWRSTLPASSVAQI